MRRSSCSAWIRLSTAVFIILVSGFGCASLSDFNRTAEGPAIWKISNDTDRGQVYLLGSVHMMKEGVAWYTSEIRDSLEQATDVVFETHLNAAGKKEIEDFMTREGLYPVGDGLKAHVEHNLFLRTAYLAKQVGVSEESLNKLKPWYAATVLGLIFVEARGYELHLGVETFIEAFVKKRSLPVSGLDSPSQQMRSFAGLAPEVQEVMLHDTVKNHTNLDATLSHLTDAWVSGDTDRLVELLIEPMRDKPLVYDALIAQRNRRWIPKITALTARPGTHFIVLGVAHLIGKDGVVQLLRDEGNKVERL